MSPKIKGYLAVFNQLLLRELVIFKRQYFGKALDSIIMFFNFIVVFGYFLPSAAGSQSYGPFMLIGSIATFGLIEAVNSRVAQVIMDVNSDRTINSFLVMPIPSKLVFVSMAISWAVIVFLLSLILFPVGKLVLFSQFDLTKICYGKLLLIYTTVNLFFGFFSLWLAGVFRNINDLGRLWCRVINPIFMFGAFFYSWKDSYTFSPLIAKLTLINPIIYVTEGMRAAALGQEGYLNYWMCLAVLWVFIIGCGWHGTHRLKKWLDCV